MGFASEEPLSVERHLKAKQKDFTPEQWRSRTYFEIDDARLFVGSFQPRRPPYQKLSTLARGGGADD